MNHSYSPLNIQSEATSPSHGDCCSAPVLQPRPPSAPQVSSTKLLSALILALLAEGAHFIAADTSAWKILGMVLALLAITLVGWPVYSNGLSALRRGRFTITALMAVAVTGAFLIGQWPEAAMVMVLYTIAEAIEKRTMDRARYAIKSLLTLAPDDAEVREADGTWQRRAVGVIAPGALVRIKPGERVPLDGTVVTGHSAVDQSPITGESLPVDKMPGDELYAGSINQAASLEMQVTARASDSTLARIIHAVEQAQASRATTQRFVDRFAAIYTPTIFVFALAVAILTPWLFGWNWLEAIYKALVLLVIVCPCALVISTPVTVISGLTAAARRGILIKGGVYLEDARKIKVIALDKTGTLTTGTPKLVAFEALAENDTTPASIATLETLARSLAARSDHPVAKAIALGLPDTVQEVEEFQAVAGRGVQGIIAGRRYILANPRWIAERQQSSAALLALLQGHQKAGHTLTLLADDQKVLALCAVADTLKPSSVEALRQLHDLDVTTVMLTGDHVDAARTVANQAGIREVQSDLLPEEKLNAIAGLQKRYGIAAMAGDGINDAPALAHADIGFAMGAAGTHTSMEAADVVIMNDDLRRIPEAIGLSRHTFFILWQNICFALGIKLIFVILALLGQATMWIAVFADMVTSLLVVANGLRLLRHRF